MTTIRFCTFFFYLLLSSGNVFAYQENIESVQWVWPNQLQLDGSLELKPTQKDDYSGGFSSLWVSKDCNSMLTISDYSEYQKGNPLKLAKLNLSHWYTADFVYDSDDSLLGIEKVVLHKTMLDKSGKPLEDYVEAIAAYDGGFVVSFDNKGTLLVYSESSNSVHPLESKPSILPKLQLDNWPDGSKNGVEALTLIDHTHALMIHEKKGPWFRDKRRYAWFVNLKDGSSNQVRYQNVLDPKGAATLPSGDVLVLESKFYKKSGLNRLRIVLLGKDKITSVINAAKDKNKKLQGTSIIDMTGSFLDNFEGISTCQKNNKQYVFIISDNNGDRDNALDGNNNQKTLLLRFELKNYDGI